MILCLDRITEMTNRGLIDHTILDGVREVQKDLEEQAKTYVSSVHEKDEDKEWER